MEDGQFSEEAVLTDMDSFNITVSGIFAFGSEEEATQVPYGVAKPVNKGKFIVSRKSLPSEVEKPWKTLEGITVIRVGTGSSYRVYDVLGYESGVLTFRLLEVKNG